MSESELYRACENGDVTTARTLIRAGVDINTRGRCNRTPLIIASMKNHPSIIELLLSSPSLDINAKDGSGYTALYYACDRGNDRVAQLLIENTTSKLNLSILSGGWTPLHAAAHNNRVGCVQQVLRHPQATSIIDARDEDGNTALDWAR